jgi:CspA family cold shock protein
MRQSTVKWFDAKKGYGFITHPDDGDDVFVHYSDIESDDDFKTLHADQHVRFELNDGPKGLNASNVVAIDGDTSTDTETPSSESSSSEASDAPPADPAPEIDPSEVDPTAEVDPISSS